MNPSPRPVTARSPAEVEVFSTATPPRPWVDVALIDAEQSSELSGDDVPQFINKMRIEAAAMGCDGIILGGTTARDTVAIGDVVEDVADALSKKPVQKSESYGQPVTLKGMTATCIVYRDPEIAIAEAPPPAPDQVAATAAAPDPEKARRLAAYDACRLQRVEIMKRASTIKDLPARGRMFRTMPSCGDRPS